MAETPWLTIVGIGEDGAEALPPASRKALAEAQIVMGPPRHLGLLGETGAEIVEWPVPFADGLDVLEGLRGRRVAVLVSGDPFWFGAGAAIARRFGAEEWRALPAPSTFSLVAAELGWPLERTHCLGLHAAPLARLRPLLAPGLRAIILLRGEEALSELAAYLTQEGFGATDLRVFSALGGPRAAIRRGAANGFDASGLPHPVAAAIEVAGGGAVLPRASGLPDEAFATDGVMTKRFVRAMTLSTLAPRPGQMLWDIGAGSGSIAVEWLLSDASTEAVAVEDRADRVALIETNRDRYGLDRLTIVKGAAPEVLTGLPVPDTVFLGGGASEEMLTTLFSMLRSGTRLVANAVTLESEALFVRWQAEKGGTLHRIALSEQFALGHQSGWKAAYPIVQWSVML
ncbi:MAG: precorrin-6y C5,15-methyltransferase (decarboxylating) subunit CbiE [Pseudomonadota bacterium]